MNYIGRFAPSPTGPLHFGSLVAALASFLDARNAGGTWLLRIEDLDPPRESRAAPKEIMAQLAALGLIWDNDVLYQSSRLLNYRDVLQLLIEAGLVYPCICTRKSVPPVYPGTCRSREFSDAESEYAIRLKVEEANIGFTDLMFGQKNWEFANQIGDFIVRRKDGLFAYQFAVVVDDHFQGVNRIVRGVDLLDSTPRQLALYHALNLRPPAYLHIPILVDRSGDKLSKQAHAKPIDISDPVRLLRQALIALGQDPQNGTASLTYLLSRAIKAWQVDRIPMEIRLSAPPDYL